jgi:hypothetical protein
MNSIKRSWVGLISFIFASLALVAFMIVAIKGLAMGITYPSFPKWFSEVADRSFYASLLLMALSFVGILIDHKKKMAVIALAISTFTVCLIAYCTTKG